MVQPKYDIGAVVYLRESAAVGSLEAVKISGIHKIATGWVYSIAAGIAGATAPAIFGDRITAINGATLFYTEDELLSVCDALVLVEANVLARYRSVHAQRIAICPTSINPTAGTDLDDVTH